MPFSRGSSQPRDQTCVFSGSCFRRRFFNTSATWCEFFAKQQVEYIYTQSGHYGEGNGTPLQYSCLENPMDGGAWWAVFHGVTKSQTRLSNFTYTFHFHALEKEMATHSSVLAWRIRDGGAWWAAVYGVAQSQTRLSDFTFAFHFHAWAKEMATHSSVLAWRIPGTGSLVGCRLWGCTESGMTEVTQQ